MSKKLTVEKLQNLAKQDICDLILKCHDVQYKRQRKLIGNRLMESYKKTGLIYHYQELSGDSANNFKHMEEYAN
tara:strand:+ start:285 stop:506 length:222 start_codon:yes stop_codon:yes gene_type:complete